MTDKTGPEEPASGSGTNPESDNDRREMPLQIGPYRILDRLGRGGMGVVYLAEQKEPVERRVALKIVGSTVLDREGRERFRAERQALARLQHPNVAQMFEAGSTDDGHPFFVMEVVDGVRLTTYCDQNELNIRQRLKLFCAVCRGVQHAHEKSILHRDLKPSNILVTDIGGEPVPKIIDFGIAKALDQPLTDATLMTGERVMGTPAYLSPEAIDRGHAALDLDTRSDVYSLGVILYEILLGVRPFDKKGDPLVQVARRISEGDARAPSTHWSTLDDATRQQVASRRQLDRSAMRRQLKGDLDWIVLKAINKDRLRRYGSPTELEADIVRHLRDEPVEASPPSLAYRTSKFARRHRGFVIGATLLVLSLTAGMVARTREAHRANLAAAEAQAALEESRQLSRFLVDLFKVSNPGESRGNTVTVRELLDRGAERILGEFEDQPLVRARFMHTIGEVYELLGLYDQARQLSEQALSARQRALGPDHTLVGSSLHQLGALAWRQGQYEEAEELLQRSLAVRVAVSEDSLEVAATLSSIANLYRVMGRSNDAEPLFRQALDIQERHLGSDAIELAQTLNNLGILLEIDERYGEAEPLYRQALAIRETNLGSDHPDVAQSLNNLAILCRAQGRYDEAEPLYQRTIDIWSESLGPDHPHVGSVLNNLGALYWLQERLDEAEPLYLRGLAIKEKALGPDHPGVASSLNNLGNLYIFLERYAEAEPLLDRALAIREAKLGKTHRGVASVLGNLAYLDAQVGRVERSERRFLRTLSIIEDELGLKASSLATPMARLAELYRDQQRYEQAEPLYLRAISILENTFGPGHESVKEVRSGYAVLLRETGRTG